MFVLQTNIYKYWQHATHSIIANGNMSISIKCSKMFTPIEVTENES